MCMSSIATAVRSSILPYLSRKGMFIHSFIHSFIDSFIHQFIHSLIHSFLHSFIHMAHSCVLSYICFQSQVHRRQGFESAVLHVERQSGPTVSHRVCIHPIIHLSIHSLIHSSMRVSVVYSQVHLLSPGKAMASPKVWNPVVEYICAQMRGWEQVKGDKESPEHQQMVLDANTCNTHTHAQTLVHTCTRRHQFHHLCMCSLRQHLDCVPSPSE
jgi:hypothetical protein